MENPACILGREEYDGLKAVNWSTLCNATKSAAHYLYGLQYPKEQTDPMRLGCLIHTVVLQPDNLSAEYAVWRGDTRRGKEWEAFEATNSGKILVRMRDLEEAWAIHEAVWNHPLAGAILSQPGLPECSLLWTDEATGLPCKARLDWLDVPVHADIKSTSTIEERAFGRHTFDMLYHCQFAFSRMGLRSHGIEPVVKIIAVESDPPYDVAVYDMPSHVLDVGEAKVRKALALVAECRKTGEWPGRYSQEVPLVLPPWAYQE